MIKNILILILLSLFLPLANSQSNIASDRIEQARQMVLANHNQLEQYMSQIEIIEERSERVGDLAQETLNFDAAIASIEVLPHGDREALDRMLNIIFSQYNTMIQTANVFSENASVASCRDEIDRKALPAYQRGLEKLNELQSLPPSATNKEQLALSTVYTLFFGTFAHFHITMALILCAR